MKPKCPKCGHPLDSYATWRGEVESYPFGVTCAKCEWMRMVPRAAIIRLAVESNKPKTCKWQARRSEFNPLTSYGTGCGVLRGILEGNYCSGCGKPVEVVNG